MGIYLGQLPPAEIARLKAELAETLIANFCYPRFFDHRTESLQMRPVDRTKRQEVWLYLSSVDFTAWSRVDLTSADFQHQIERLFIQFMQRNRSFFGEQGRRRMADVRMLINSCAAAVAQRLRNHLTGQKSNNPPFGTPRQVVSWSATPLSGRVAPSWEQISSSTMQLQQQLQELRGEIKAAIPADGRVNSPAASQPQTANLVGAASSALRATPRPVTASPTNGSSAVESRRDAILQPTAPNAPVSVRPPAPVPDSKNGSSLNAPAASVAPVIPVVPVRRSGQLTPPAVRPIPERKAEPVVPPAASFVATPPPVSSPPLPARPGEGRGRTSPLPESRLSVTGPHPARSNGHTSPSISAITSAVASSREPMTIGEDDVAIFEQMRHQLVIWLRVEAITAGLEVSGQGPAQLLDMLRQQAHLDETRLQVVSTLLNLANQVIKTGQVSILDYKQALMFHLMHTRRA